MSLKPLPDHILPEEPARVAKAAFPQGKLCLRMHLDVKNVVAMSSRLLSDELAAQFTDSR